MKYLLTIVLIVISSTCFAADTWWVRHGHTTGDDGGGDYANAWKGLDAITWGVGGVVAGDTLYVCGATYDDVLSVGESGTDGNLIIIRGDCSSVDGGYTDGIIGRRSLTNASVSGTTTYAHSLAVSSQNYITIQDLAFDDPFGVRDKDKLGNSSGAHTGAQHATILTVAGTPFVADDFIGGIVFNTTDSSKGIITDNSTSTVTVDSLTSGAWDDGDTFVITKDHASIMLKGTSNNITIKDNTFLLNDGDIGYAILGHIESGTSIHDITIQDNTFTGGDETAIMFYQKGDPIGTYYNLTIDGNTATDQYVFFWSRNLWGSYDEIDADMDGDDDDDYAPYGIDIKNNTIGIKNGGFKAISFAGMHIVSGDGKNYIRDNTITTTGTQIGETNLIQVSWAKDLIIEDNTITGPALTSNCDGCAIIVDWAFKNGGEAIADDYISDDVIVRDNRIIDADSTGCNGKGINVYRGSNIQVYRNLITGSDIGIKWSSDATAGNTSVNGEMWNNTIYDSAVDGIYIEADTPEVDVKNNLIETTGDDGIDDDSGNISEDYSLLYDITNTDCEGFTCGANNVYTDPLLDGNYEITSSSPAYNAGYDVGLTYCYNDPDIGWYEFCYASISGITIGKK